jgi:hypothetical protein
MSEQREHDAQHEEWLADIAEQLAPIFEHSREGVYVYLDDRHKICNERCAKLFGFASARDWAAEPDFLNSFVVAADRGKVSRAYHEHIHQAMTPARFTFTAKGPDGKARRFETDMVPFTHAGQMFAYQFVRQAKPARKKPAASPPAKRRPRR